MSKILLGLDIGSQFIKGVQISRNKNKFSLLSAGYIATPKVDADMVGHTDEQVIANAVNQLVHDLKLSTGDVVLSLPSYKVTTQIIEIPVMNEKEIESSIQWEAEQYIPLPLNKVKIDYSIIGKNDVNNRMKIVLVAAPITLIEKYMRIINLTGLNPVAIETEILAGSRSIINSLPTLPNMVMVAIGATGTEIAIVREKILVFTKNYPIGGNTLTRAISEELGFDFAQAEEYKKTYGLEEDKLEGKLNKIMMPFFSNLFAEIEKTIAYFREEYPKEELMTLVISGGTAKLSGLMLSTTKYIGVNSQIANPFINIEMDQDVLQTLNPDAPMYTTAIGLALKEI
ncbi:hypothetical protein A3D05_06670 [Candidatus Gottesmanbacteria bacterium RIFCSPHIGHO2_02_FULL_40_24]|uniref:SHS2 domain-containing protein n=1 Tax=Candidatus Gottesmanbacteria bacterium RIFCSPHIGHO2_01_FULL_40_15 TaxID=1798376 RepID=A0A1F5Z3J3_9BACT|nr:MAG: hypothetical protein A2777_03720 [Candidatus Gottesmanbacteria bacterium RIFCSPHIGHO2_01_FULL_40_15]OGG17195.1 MAG: hypothetical protein A3D05_06670 [Candidatus Gottesmanbacteria bacterium RIFCSPHIGHO2_02_FULL_40_24]OGG22372.1 MAG: hypothetical protein A3B48_02600 [Candidatus Gottesmanbacteria bacterium RIFCSPLOWO2_01_FULL_40_10]OGG23589.1 MAG: hypothetical protein A3E42_05405 [Candidatus Gottesmanbacteria bacterium RIFCSPHIGHO2_12_FULL_40_13]OGG32227.1 MAG: hypothetical protein A3I80_0